LKSFNDNIKLAIYWVCLGASLVVYAHENFASKDAIKKLDTVSTQADITRLENKIDRINDYLLEHK
jgi:hypothetical protein